MERAKNEKKTQNKPWTKIWLKGFETVMVWFSRSSHLEAYLIIVMEKHNRHFLVRNMM